MDTAEDTINLASKLELLIPASQTISIVFVIICAAVLTAMGVENIFMFLSGDPGTDVRTYYITIIVISVYFSYIIINE